MARRKQKDMGATGAAGAKQGTLGRVFADLGPDRKRMLVLVVVIGLAKVALACAPRVAGGITDYFSKGSDGDTSWFLG